MPTRVLKLGLVASLSGRNQKVGTGARDSLQFSVEKCRPILDKSGVDVAVVVHDDHSSPLGVVWAFKRCIEDGCVAVVGPSDSEPFHYLLELIQEKRFPEVSLFATLATATDLTETGCTNLVRLTTPNVQRVEMLLREVATRYPTGRVEVFAATGTRQSYGQSLKRDVERVAEQLKTERPGLSYHFQEFSVGGIAVDPPAKGAPIVVCAVSADGIELVRHLRAKKGRTPWAKYAVRGQAFSNQVFAFGSNSNWLTPETVGTIVVCDLDRQPAEPMSRDYLDEFAKKFPESKDPSIPTMYAGHIVVCLARKHAQVFGDDVAANRRAMLGLLREQEGLEGPFVRVSISPKGEMFGHEAHLALMKVTRRRGGLRRRAGFTFEALAGGKEPVVAIARKSLIAVAGGFLTVGLGHVANVKEIFGDEVKQAFGFIVELAKAVFGP